MQYLSKILILTLVYFGLSQITIQAAEMKEPLHPEWSFEGPLGKFERASLQRGYQVYTEVCSGCHSMELLSYRNLYILSYSLAKLDRKRVSTVLVGADI